MQPVASVMASSSRASIKSVPNFVPPKLKDFIFTEKLGSGTYATVYKAYKKSSEHRDVLAIKCIRKSSLNRTSTENLLVEIEILKQIKHEHIVQLVDFQWDDSYIYLIMEYCGGGDLSMFIQARRLLPEYVVKRFLQQLASALQLLHSHNISHMDLKPQNILLTSYEHPVLKIADFGFAQYVEASRDYSIRGSPLYMAPEMILQHQYDAKVDLWSVGVILYEALFGRAPFASKSFEELEKKIQSDQPIEIPSTPTVSGDCQNLLMRLLQRNPQQRISFEEFFLHPFVDLEHRPSAECLPKATNILVQAVNEDQNGNVKKAIKLYSQAVEYLVPAIYYEPDKHKKDSLRIKVKEYCARAEDLKQRSKPQKPVTEESAREKLFELSRDNPDLINGLQLLFAGRSKELEEKFEDALDLYTKALGELIPLLEAEVASKRKELLHEQIQLHLGRAEAIRHYISVTKVQVKRIDSTSLTSSTHGGGVEVEEHTQRCTLQ
uniref:Serine/threonine-protein kinase ULK3 n=1 Tax=Phallusia mammillata TaxID=59560 RepID=A0A6F9DVQ6_9ASCI|nr:serine/threonine-protein kinase ULK3-like [Phallusia mammillata]